MDVTKTALQLPAQGLPHLPRETLSNIREIIYILTTRLFIKNGRICVAFAAKIVHTISER